MGFKAWRSVGVLVLAGAALVGCNNGPQRDNRVVSGGPNNSNPYANANQKSQGFSTQQQQFPMVNKSTTIGQNNNPAAPPFPGATSTPFGAGNGMQPAGGTVPGDLNSLKPLPTNSNSMNPALPNTGSNTFAPTGPAFPPVNQTGGNSFGSDLRNPAPMPGGSGYGPIGGPPPLR